jgi:hypothetical protein
MASKLPADGPRAEAGPTSQTGAVRHTAVNQDHGHFPPNSFDVTPDEVAGGSVREVP